MNEGRTNVVTFRVCKWTGMCVYPRASKISFLPHFILQSLLASLPFFVLCSHGFVLILLHRSFFFKFNSLLCLFLSPPISVLLPVLLSILLLHTSSFSFPILLLHLFYKYSFLASAPCSPSCLLFLFTLGTLDHQRQPCPGLPAQLLAQEQGWQPKGGVSLHPGCADRKTHWNGCLHLSPWSESDIKSLKPVSDAFKWVKTLEIESLPICCECLTVTDLNVYPHEDPFTLRDCVKWLQGKWIWAREGINSLLEMLFMLFPVLNFPHLSHFQFLKEKSVGLGDVSGQSGSCVGLSSSFCVKTPWLMRASSGLVGCKERAWAMWHLDKKAPNAISNFLKSQTNCGKPLLKQLVVFNHSKPPFLLEEEFNGRMWLFLF